MESTLTSTRNLVLSAFEHHTAIPAFNIPYLPMVEPVVRALRDHRVMGLIMVARLEWMKFESQSMEAVRDAYRMHVDPEFTRLHLDHIPVIDEDQFHVPYLLEIEAAIGLGYESVMIDGSRLDLDTNIAATAEVCRMAHAKGVPVEGELGAVLGHESGPMPPYEELFRTGRGFTDPEEAVRFVKETQVDWLSIACGNVHGAISAAKKNEKKISARLNVDHIEKIAKLTGVPLVLHGGTGIKAEHVREAIGKGIAKINIATAIRQPYEQIVKQDPQGALEAVYDATCRVLVEDLHLGGNADLLQS